MGIIFMYWSISEEGSETVSDVAKHVIELLLGVEFLVLAEGGIVISDMLPNLLVESVSQGRNRHDCYECTCNDVWNFYHYVSSNITFL